MNSAVLPEYLTIAEAAELLRVDKSTIRRWIGRGDFPVHRLGERVIRIRRSDLESSGVATFPGGPVVQSGTLPANPPRKLTPEERLRGLDVLEAMARGRGDQRARGERFDDPPSWLLISEARDERADRLSGG